MHTPAQAIKAVNRKFNLNLEDKPHLFFEFHDSSATGKGALVDSDVVEAICGQHNAHDYRHASTEAEREALWQGSGGWERQRKCLVHRVLRAWATVCQHAADAAPCQRAVHVKSMAHSAILNGHSCHPCRPHASTQAERALTTRLLWRGMFLREARSGCW